MKKHYTFIPIKDADIKKLRRALLGDLWFRPIFSLLIAFLMAYIGYLKYSILRSDFSLFLLYCFAFAIIIYTFIVETQKFYFISRLKRSHILPLIHSVKWEPSFYAEELANGYIIQTEAVNIVDISNCKEDISNILADFKDSLYVVTYLKTCLSSGNKSMINKAIIYTEIIKDQLAMGNLAILATHDKLVNYKGEK